MIEQITYLLFLRRLDEIQTLEENKAERTGMPAERRVYPAGNDPQDRPYADLRWSRFRNFAPGEMYEIVADHASHFCGHWGVKVLTPPHT